MENNSRAAFQVLIVDDDPDYLLLLTHALKSVDPAVEVCTATCSDEATLRLQSSEPRLDLILLDIHLPGPSGFEVLRRVKQDPDLRVIPVVMSTSSDLQADIQRAYELGASGYINKLSYDHDLHTILSHTMLYWSAMRRASA